MKTNITHRETQHIHTRSNGGAQFCFIGFSQSQGAVATQGKEEKKNGGKKLKKWFDGNRVPVGPSTRAEKADVVTRAVLLAVCIHVCSMDRW